MAGSTLCSSFTRHVLLACGAAALLACASVARAEPRYAWKRETPAQTETLALRFPPPLGFERAPAAPGSFAAWLRGLPLKTGGTPVLLHTGARKWRQDVHAAVIDIDVGPRDLQQCADAIMRLRGEWLFSNGRKADIAFDDTEGRRMRFASRAKQDYTAFRKYMNFVFAYAGTYSLARELKAVTVEDIRAGDVFIKGGFPGHAVLVADLVVNPATGEKRFLLAQSYMPAQEIHILKNPSETGGTVWYRSDFGDTLVTPEWNFSRTQLKRWTF
ncbi:MAG: DUF4846 domain-containing protein [Hyphomicrobium sp.]|jgi:hypothetical protein|nr:DUF4846 domain-containing protein [Hyphomicrobium sp.]